MRRHLLPAAASLSLLAAGAGAQTVTGNAVTGKSLFENTAQTSGNAGLPSCTSCHGSVEDRRSAVSAATGNGADIHAQISFDSAYMRLSQALQNQAAMAPLRVLTTQQVSDIAAYIADTPKTNPPAETQLNFTAALNGNSAAQTVTLTHAVTASENLVVTSITLFGAGASSFVVGNRAQCEGVTLTPTQSCAINVTYAPTSTSAASADLVLTMREGAATNATFDRVLPMSGTVSSSGGTSGDGGGGGALGLGWLLALGAAVAALSRRRG